MKRKLVDLLRDTTFPDRDRHWLVPCFAGGIMAGVLWIAIDRVIQLRQSGAFFAPLGWSVTSLFVCVAIGSAVGLVAGWGERTWRRRWTEGTKEAAQQMGFSYYPNAEILRPLAKLFPRWKDWHQSDRLMTGERDGISVQVFDLTTVSRGLESGGYSHSTIVLLPGSGLPDFDMSPRSFLMRAKWAGLHFEPGSATTQSDAKAIEEFTRLYRVYSGCPKTDALGCSPQDAPDAEQAIRLLFTPSVMQRVVPVADWYVECRNGRLTLCHGRGFRPPGERPKLIEEALAIRSALLQRA